MCYMKHTRLDLGQTGKAGDLSICNLISWSVKFNLFGMNLPRPPFRETFCGTKNLFWENKFSPTLWKLTIFIITCSLACLRVRSSKNALEICYCALSDLLQCTVYICLLLQNAFYQISVYSLKISFYSYKDRCLLVYDTVYSGRSLFVCCFPSRSVIPYKYKPSVDNTALYLYTKIVYSYFVKATCFRLIRSSSGLPRRQLQELFMFHCIVGSQTLTSFWIP